jgi:hypothetical protein
MLKIDLEATRRRQRAGVTGRRIGWLLLPFVLTSTTLYYTVGNEVLVTWIATIAVIALSTVHAAVSFYVFGLVRPRLTVRVFHVYLGYALFLLIVASQTNLHREPLHTVLTALMYAAIVGHVVLATRTSLHRRMAHATLRRSGSSAGY